MIRECMCVYKIRTVHVRQYMHTSRGCTANRLSHRRFQTVECIVGCYCHPPTMPLQTRHGTVALSSSSGECCNPHTLLKGERQTEGEGGKARYNPRLKKQTNKLCLLCFSIFVCFSLAIRFSNTTLTYLWNQNCWRWNFASWPIFVISFEL